MNAGAQYLMHALCVTMYLEPHTKGAWLFVSTIWNIFIEPDLMVLLFAESLPIHFCHEKCLLCHCRIILSITWGLQVIKHNISSSILFLCVSFETFWRIMCFHLLFVLNLKDLQFEFYNFENMIIVYKSMQRAFIRDNDWSMIIVKIHALLAKYLKCVTSFILILCIKLKMYILIRIL